MRAVFFGSPDDAVPALDRLLKTGVDVAAVYTRPDRKAGRSRSPQPTPVRVVAEAKGLLVETPQGLRDSLIQERLMSLGADVFVVVAYGRILPPEVLAMPRLGVVNIHPSLLPLHRGPSPVSTAILNGDDATGVTVMLLDEGMDSGPLLMQSDPVVMSGVERTGELTKRLFEMGAEMLPGVLEGLENGTLVARPQDEERVTVTRLMKKQDGRIDWSAAAEHIERMTRAFDPWPGAFTSLKGKNLKILTAAIGDQNQVEGQPGLVTVAEKRLFVSTGEKSLELLELQAEGRRSMAVHDFLNGEPDLHGSVLGE